ncbi:MAG: NlpC/P60 family protein [Thermoleophilia bacterium]|nr:NlpC/P60 family protein [Thermoleophilia bacterium]
MIAGAAALLLATPPGPSSADPAAIREKRAQIAQIEDQLAALDSKVGLAAEAFNGARYRLGLVKQRMRQNRSTLAGANRSLDHSRTVLAERLVDLYTRPRPTLADVLVGSGSVTGVVSGLNAIERAGREDAGVVGNVRQFRTRVVKARLGLIEDRREAAAEVREAAERRSEVEALLRQRQEVLDSARGDLQQLIEEERERRRRLAELQRQRALEAQRAAEQARREAAVSSGIDPTTIPDLPLPSGEGNGRVVPILQRYLGVPYVWGGASPSGFDCSGLASYAYAQLGISVPHYTVAIWNAFPKVPRGQEQPGDMLLFNGLGHMGIYVGGGQMIHAPHTGDVVRYAPAFARSDYLGAVRP